MIKLIILLFVFSSSAALSDIGLSVCEDQKNLKQIYQYVIFLKTKTDKVKLNHKCIEIITKESRESLYVNYLRSKIPNIKIFSTNSSSRSECRLVLIKKINIAIHNDSVLFSNKKVSVGKLNSKSEVTEEIEILTQENKEMELIVNDDVIILKCSITNSGYRVVLKSRTKKIHLNTSALLISKQMVHVGKFKQHYNKTTRKVKIISNKYSNKIKYNEVNLYLKSQ
jgi:hypothetical protein